MVVVYVVYKKRYISDIFDNPQGFGKDIIEEIISVRLTEESAKEDVNNSLENLDYIKKIVR